MDDIKLQIKNLKKSKRYNEIYKLYGSEAFLKNTSVKFKKEDIKKLADEKRYFEIYEKYGETEYNNYLKKFKNNDIISELGIKPKFISSVFFDDCKKNFKLIRKTIYKLAIINAVIISIISGEVKTTVRNNEIKYADELENYDKNISSYADYINSLDLSDLEVLVKVMEDMWNDIDGYKDPTSYDDIGVFRLSNYIDGYGICRNFADDYAHRLNAINDKYKACVISTYISKAELNNIERNIIQSNETVSDENTSNDEKKNNFDTTKYTGNHAVVCLNLDNAIIIVDPTNPSIGMVKNGKIEMFSDFAKDGMYSTPFSNFLFDNGEGYSKLLKSYIASGDYEYLKEKYGIEAQNEALENIENYENNYRMK